MSGKLQGGIGEGPRRGGSGGWLDSDGFSREERAAIRPKDRLDAKALDGTDGRDRNGGQSDVPRLKYTISRLTPNSSAPKASPRSRPLRRVSEDPEGRQHDSSSSLSFSNRTSSEPPEHPTIWIVRRISRPVSRATRAARGPESGRARRESPASR